MDINAAFPGTFVKAADLGGQDRTVAVASVVMEDLGGEHKPAVYFQGTDKGLVLNKTNAATITALYGSDTDAWIGKTITLYPTETDYQGKRVECIRIRSAMTAPEPAPAAQQEAPAADDIPF